MNWRECVLNLKNNNHCIYSKHKESAIEVYKNRSNRITWKCPAGGKKKKIKMEIQESRKSPQFITFLACFLCWCTYILNLTFQKSISNASILKVIFHIHKTHAINFLCILATDLKLTIIYISEVIQL